MSTTCYAGVGARATPTQVLGYMEDIADLLRERRCVLRSGGAKGADQAFERGALGYSDIYLPSSTPPKWTEVFTMYFHPNPEKLDPFGWNAMCRNAVIMLGINGDSPVDFVVCWTKDGKDSGGTGQAIRIANAFDIPVYNLYNGKDFSELASRIVKMEIAA